LLPAAFFPKKSGCTGTFVDAVGGSSAAFAGGGGGARGGKFDGKAITSFSDGDALAVGALDEDDDEDDEDDEDEEEAGLVPPKNARMLLFESTATTSPFLDAFLAVAGAAAAAPALSVPGLDFIRVEML
jgi:hypothetical protein